MKNDNDPLAIVREVRIRLSIEGHHDPRRVIENLRKRESKFTRKIGPCRVSHARVAEERTEYGEKKRAVQTDDNSTSR